MRALFLLILLLPLPARGQIFADFITTAGTFSMLADDLFAGNDVEAFTLVERVQNQVVGRGIRNRETLFVQTQLPSGSLHQRTAVICSCVVRDHDAIYPRFDLGLGELYLAETLVQQPRSVPSDKEL